MNAFVSDNELPVSSGMTFAAGAVSLRFVEISPGVPERGFVPAYRFHILVRDDVEVGHVSFRVGDTDHVRLVAGHIGYGVAESHRGNGYARLACLAIVPLIRRFYEEVLITCDPENEPSRRTIERLGATFVDEIRIPAHDPHYARGSRWKRRYLWKP